MIKHCQFCLPNEYNVCFKGVIFAFLLIASCARFDLLEEPAQIIADEDWIIPDGPVQELRERTWNLQHQKLRVRFDFEEEKVLGQTELLLTAKKNQSTLILDAKTMEFDSIYHVASNRRFTYEQDSAIVTIHLDQNYEAGDTLIVGIDFVSHPPSRGLYFVNPTGADPVKPTQIWTLGQPEDNSFWFPTIDHPAERTTQETWISVPPEFTTLSNGLLKERRIHPGDSLRTDYWRLNQPHTPYLFVIAAGQYEVIEEIHDDILYRYYVEPEFSETVDLIYENTVDMIRFSEKKTGVPYPWDPVYAQAPVHDFIARGMENTTATLLYDAVQFDRRAAEDLSNQDLIMHEIIHQWLGNLVTAKNWANLPINEGFANFFESAYRQHNNGEEAYLWKVQNDRLLYFTEAQEYRRPVIFDRYTIPEDMYDRHTYQKAGQILRMLRDYLGDDKWWEGVRMWVEKFSFKSVDIYDLQDVYETVHGENLDWFFRQWFLEPGHPYLDFSREIDGNRVYMYVGQVQDTTRQPVFRLHPEILITFENGDYTTERIRIDETEHEFFFEYDADVTDVILDPNRVQLAEYYIALDDETLVRRTENERLLVRSEALTMLEESLENPSVKELVIQMAKSDPFWGIRLIAMDLISDNKHYFTPREIVELVSRTTREEEDHFEVRRTALRLLRNIPLNDDSMRETIRGHLKALSDDRSYFVSAKAIVMYGELFPDDAASLAGRFISQESYQDVIRNAVSEALSNSDSEESIDLLIRLADNPGYKEYTYTALVRLIDIINEFDGNVREQAEEVFAQRLNDPYARYRILAYEALAELGATGFLERLYKNRERNDLEEFEKRVLRNAIRSLEFEMKLNN